MALLCFSSRAKGSQDENHFFFFFEFTQAIHRYHCSSSSDKRCSQNSPQPETNRGWCMMRIVYVLHGKRVSNFRIVTAAATVVPLRPCKSSDHVATSQRELKHLQIVPRRPMPTHSSSFSPARASQNGEKAFVALVARHLPDTMRPRALSLPSSQFRVQGNTPYVRLVNGPASFPLFLATNLSRVHTHA